jgi:membrane-bound metal-dependent hydrolase YbcI (DUF457 family)
MIREKERFSSPDALAHVLFAYSLLSLMHFSRNEILIASLLATLPDVDLAYKHRMLCHNLFFVFIVPFLISLYLHISYLAILMALLSHVSLDLFNYSGVALLYPISSERYGLGLFKSGWPTLMFVLFIVAALIVTGKIALPYG